MKTEEDLKGVLNTMNLHESMVFENTKGKYSKGGSPIKCYHVTKVIGGWIYIIDYGTNSESPVFVPSP